MYVKRGYIPIGPYNENKNGIIGPRGIGFLLTEKGNYDMKMKLLKNVNDPIDKNDAINLQTINKIKNECYKKINDLKIEYDKHKIDYQKYVESQLLKHIMNINKTKEFNMKSINEDKKHDEELKNINNQLIEINKTKREYEKSITEFKRSETNIESILLNQQALSLHIDKIRKPKIFILKLKQGFYDIKEYMEELSLIEHQKVSFMSLLDDKIININETDIYKISIHFFYTPFHKKIFQVEYDNSLIENVSINNSGKEDRGIDNIFYEYSFIAKLEQGKEMSFSFGNVDDERSSILFERKSGVPPPYSVPNENRLNSFSIFIEKLISFQKS
jgi:hypothetical protein